MLSQLSSLKLDEAEKPSESSAPSSQKSGETRDNARGFFHRTGLFIDHRSSSLSSSIVLTPDSQFTYVSSYGVDENDETKPVRTLRDDLEERNIVEFLFDYCQQVLLSVPVPSQVFYVAADAVQSLFAAVDGKIFKRDLLPYGIQGLRKRKRTRTASPSKENEKVRMVAEKYGNTTVEYDIANKELEKYQLVKFIFRPVQQDFEWLCFLKGDHKEYSTYFADRFWTFPEVMATALEVFDAAEQYLALPSNYSDSKLVIGALYRKQYEKVTRIVPKEEYLPYFLATRPQPSAESHGIGSKDKGEYVPYFLATRPRLSTESRRVTTKDGSVAISTSHESDQQRPSLSSKKPPPVAQSPHDLSTSSREKLQATPETSILSPEWHRREHIDGIESTGSESTDSLPTMKSNTRSEDKATDSRPVFTEDQPTKVSLSRSQKRNRKRKEKKDKMKAKSSVTTNEAVYLEPTSSTLPKSSTEVAVAEGDSTLSKSTHSKATYSAPRVDFTEEKGEYDEEEEEGWSESTPRAATETTPEVASVEEKEEQREQEEFVPYQLTGSAATESCLGSAPIQAEIIPSEPTDSAAAEAVPETATAEDEVADSEIAPPPQRGSFPTAPPNEHNIYRFDAYELYCWKHDCRNPTNCWDGSSVICPACGPWSYVRYCRIQHFYDDLVMHWALECRRNAIPESINVDETTIVHRQIDLRPFITSPYWDSLERYRQATYYCVNKTSDYYIFYDMEGLPGGLNATPTGEQYALVRGRGRIGAMLDFSEENPEHSGQRHFHDLLEECLRNSVDNTAQVYVLVAMIRQNLIDTGRWTVDLVGHFCVQVWFEFRFAVPVHLQYPYFQTRTWHFNF